MYYLIENSIYFKWNFIKGRGKKFQIPKNKFQKDLIR